MFSFKFWSWLLISLKYFREEIKKKKKTKDTVAKSQQRSHPREGHVAALHPILCPSTSLKMVLSKKKKKKVDKGKLGHMIQEPHQPQGHPQLGSLQLLSRLSSTPAISFMLLPEKLLVDGFC